MVSRGHPGTAVVQRELPAPAAASPHAVILRLPSHPLLPAMEIRGSAFSLESLAFRPVSHDLGIRPVMGVGAPGSASTPSHSTVYRQRARRGPRACWATGAAPGAGERRAHVQPRPLPQSQGAVPSRIAADLLALRSPLPAPAAPSREGPARHPSLVQRQLTACLGQAPVRAPRLSSASRGSPA